MAGNIPPTEIDQEEKRVATTRRSEPVTVEVPIVSRVVSRDESVTFDEAKETSVILIQEECCPATSGQLRVKKDSASNDISIFVANPDNPPSEGASGKHIWRHVRAC